MSSLRAYLLVAIMSFLTGSSDDHLSVTHMTESNNKDNFAKEWKKVDDFEQKGRPESALKEVIKIQSQAKKKYIKAQIIKTVIYRAKYIQQLEEDGAIAALTYFESEVLDAPQPVRSILSSQLAELYKGYLDRASWQIRQRTEVAAGASKDIKEWTIGQFTDRIADLHIQAVSDKRLQKNDLNEFLAILNDGEGRALRPKVYDLLAHRAIDYFSDTRSLLTESQHAFHIDHPSYWGPAKVFSKMDLDAMTKGDAKQSNKFRALQLLQSTIKYQLKARNPKGLVDVDVKRLQFLRRHSTSSDKDNMYERALNELAHNYRKKGGAELALLELARYAKQRGDLTKAIEKSNAIIGTYPNTDASKAASSIVAQIKRKSLTAEAEDVQIPRSPILFKVNYKNIKKLEYRVYRLDEKQYDRYQNEMQRDRFEAILKMSVYRVGSKDIADFKDYKAHSAEISMDGLPVGRYIILLSDNGKFAKINNSTAGMVEFQVTNLGMWNRNTTEGKTSIVVVDRTSGLPLEGVEAIFSTRKNRKDGWKEAAKTKSDEEGFVLPKLTDRQSYRVALKHKDDVYYSDSNLYEHRPHKNNNVSNKVTFFTDRKLYRPGQTVYYKGLAVQSSNKGIPSILAGMPVEVTIKDANHQVVTQFKHATNEFGTFHGAFTAPESGLNGQMYIQSSIGGSAYIQVEEYKRPTFEVLVDTVKAANQPGDKVTVTGLAQAYAGFGIDGANVEIRVTKEQRFWCYPWWRRGWSPAAQGVKEVYQTSTTTDGEGRYDFEFESDEDKGADRFAYYNYVVHIDVTNQAGETRSGESSLNLSETPFSLETSLAAKNDIEGLNSLNVIAKNFAGQKVAVNGSVKILALTSPEHTFKERYWSVADTIMITREQFKAKYPDLAYDEEDQLKNWAINQVVYDQKFESNTVTSIDPSDWGAGYYKIQIEGKDDKGRSQELETYFEIFDTKDQYIPHNATLWSHLKDKAYAPGDKVEYWLGSAEKSVQVLFEVAKWGELVVSRWVEVSDLDKLVIDIDEADRGNLITSIHYAHGNRSYHESKVISVPWTNKNLDIELSSYRDKTKPGSEEQWTVSIKNPGYPMHETELVAAMYDASLDAIMGHNWSSPRYPIDRGLGGRRFNFDGWHSVRYQQFYDMWGDGATGSRITYPSINWFGLHMGYGRQVRMRGAMSKMSAPAPMVAEESFDRVWADVPEGTYNDEAAVSEPESDITNFAGDIRDNLNETVFFYPELKTDADGNIEFSFTMNDALTRWKFLAFGHTKEMEFGQTEALITTQKELMVIPHLPRFLRQDDEITITSTVKNLSEKPLSGKVQLRIIDALTGANLDEAFHNHQNVVNANLQPGLSTASQWLIKVPSDHVTPVRLEVVAVAGDYSDGQVDEIPVVTNRTLVTETLPLWVNGGDSKDFTFEALLNESDSKVNHNYAVEFTSNPVWYAVQALPYMMEYPNDCTEQIWNRYFAHALGTDIIDKFPAIKAVMAKWENTDALLSNLQKNQELKSALLKETPWVMDALSEEEQKKNIALLFDMAKMEASQVQNLKKIVDRQAANGGFAWFTGGRSNIYITQYILEGMGRMNQLDVKNSSRDKTLNSIVANAIDFVDAKISERYAKLLELEGQGVLDLSKNNLSSLDIHYLYARSFFPARKFAPDAYKAFLYYKDQARKFWVDRSINEQAMLGIGLYQFDEKKYVKDMMISLKERSLKSDELGIYWKYNRGYHWSQAPVETQAKLITLYELMGENAASVNELKKWLIKHKQTNRWNTTKSTAAAIHALLLSGDDWVAEDAAVELKVAGQAMDNTLGSAEAGSGYFKQTFDIDQVDDSYAKVSVKNPNTQPVFGSVYYQYWEDMNAVENFQDTPLKLTKLLFKKVNSPTGPELKAITENDPLEVGDLMTVRIVLEVDRPMEFVHMKDSRSSALEPENVISHYKWQDGLGYYESTKDLSTDFFFDRLPRGKYVFEYPLRVSHKGQFSNAITTIQCMYAPEFTSHSDGVDVTVK